MLGIQNLSGRMVDPDESTELWCPPKISLLSPPPSRDVVVEQQRVLERPEHREQRAQGPRLQAHRGRRQKRATGHVIAKLSNQIASF